MLYPEALPRAVWRYRQQTYVSFPDLRRCFAALAKLEEAGRQAEFDGRTANNRFWIVIYEI